ncbi:MAG: DNA N-6-adenine-methyltransferase, partial [Cyanobacteria bacterium P01_A01_bin.68]
MLGTVDLDPCADDGKHLEAAKHYTIVDDGLIREWEGKVYINPPFSHPGVWMKKLQSEMESERVKEAIALIPAATDTKWLSPLLKSQPVCFWTGRIKFLNKDYQPKNSARQSHVLVYWGENWERFKDVFEPHGFVSIPSQSNGDNLDNKISPRKINKGDKFLEDKTKDRISSLETEQLEFLGDNLGENISPR